jgi:hypothetical protein
VAVRCCTPTERTTAVARPERPGRHVVGAPEDLVAVVVEDQDAGEHRQEHE